MTTRTRTIETLQRGEARATIPGKASTQPNALHQIANPRILQVGAYLGRFFFLEPKAYFQPDEPTTLRNVGIDDVAVPDWPFSPHDADARHVLQSFVSLGLLVDKTDIGYRPTPLGIRLLPEFPLHYERWRMQSNRRYHRLSEAVRGKRALDAGCGVGAFSIQLHKFGAQSVLAIDVDRQRINSARWFCRQARATVRFSIGSIESLPLADQSVDVIHCRLVFPYLKPRRALAEIARTLTPGGLAFLQLHGPGYYTRRLLPKSVSRGVSKEIVLGMLGLWGGATLDLTFRSPHWYSPRGWFREAYLRRRTLHKLASLHGLELIEWEEGEKPHALLRKPVPCGDRDKSARDESRSLEYIPPVRRWMWEVAALCIRATCLPLVVRHTVAKSRVSILVYHDPRPETIRAHLRYLAKRYRFITSDRLVSAMTNGNWSTIPAHSLVVTLDDGHAANRALMDAFHEFGARPTIFLCSSIVGTSRRFWFQQCGDKMERYKRMSNVLRQQALAKHHEFEQEADYAEELTQALNMGDLEAMRHWADFGAHTRFHPILTKCGKHECRSEIAESKSEVEALVGHDCRHFAYPNGDYGKREIELVREAGFVSARSTDPGWNGPKTDCFRLKSVAVTGDVSVNILIAQLSGMPAMVRRTIRRLTYRK